MASPRASTCSTACFRPGWPATRHCSRLTGESVSGNATIGTSFDRLTKSATATPARTTLRPILHHLYRADEILGMKLGTIHNVRFLVRQMEIMRASIMSGTFSAEHRAFLDRYKVVGQSVTQEAV